MIAKISCNGHKCDKEAMIYDSYIDLYLCKDHDESISCKIRKDWKRITNLESRLSLYE